ncbi:unnamed protein product [Sphagnum balticum]
MTGKTAVPMQWDALKSGLSVWMDLHKIDLGGEIIVSGLGTNQAIEACFDVGLTPVLADVNFDTLQPTIKTLQAAKTSKTVAVLVKHYGGYPCPMDEIWAWCKARRLFLIDDSSEALPTTYKTWSNGSWPSDMTYFVFTTGAVLCSKEADIARHASYPVTTGFESPIFSLVDAMPELYEVRAKTWRQYTKAFEDLEMLELPWEDGKQVKQARAFYPLRMPSAANELIVELSKIGVQLPSVVWPQGDDTRIPVVVDFLERGIALPLSINEKQAEKIIQVVKDVSL